MAGVQDDVAAQPGDRTMPLTLLRSPGTGTVGRQSVPARMLVSADMETHEIRYFLATARELNFTRAAGACNVTQPALTRAIKKLETELGGSLFLRRPGRIELTRLARTVMPQLEAIERSMAQVRDEAQSIADQRFPNGVTPAHGS